MICCVLPHCSTCSCCCLPGSSLSRSTAFILRHSCHSQAFCAKHVERAIFCQPLTKSIFASLDCYCDKNQLVATANLDYGEGPCLDCAVRQDCLKRFSHMSKSKKKILRPFFGFPFFHSELDFPRWDTAVHYWAVLASTGSGQSPLSFALLFPDTFDHILARWVCENSLKDPGNGPSGVLRDHSRAVPQTFGPYRRQNFLS